MKRRFGAEIELKPPQVPYVETIRKPAKAHGRYKKQTGGRGQFGDCHIEISPAEPGAGLEFENAIKGGVIPGGFIPAVEKGDRRGDGATAWSPATRSRTCSVRLFDGQHHTRRLLGDGVQDRRLDGLQAGRGEGRRRPCSSRSCS